MRVRRVVEELHLVLASGSRVQPMHALQALRHRRGVVALDSAGGAPAQLSLVAFDPLRLGPPPARLEELEAWCAQVQFIEGDPAPVAFGGGWIGACSYDLGVAGEQQYLALPRDPWRLPLLVGGVYCDYLAFDHTSGRVWLVLGAGELDGRASLAERHASIFDDLTVEEGQLSRDLVPCRSVGPLVRKTQPAEHRARITAAREAIARGEYYQANVAHRFERSVSGDPLDLYLRLRRVNAAPYAGYLAWEAAQVAGEAHTMRGAILCSSPELLLDYNGSEARTRPIKGTIPRGATAAEDARQKTALLASEKDRAELAMIVDLERNDLGRLALTGGVRVEGFPRLESYAAVHHLVTDVIARMGPGVRGEALLMALFPGGSITGAPKVAAMRAIAELEGEGRGWFTGALGWISHDGQAQWNILIRTLVWRPGPTAQDPNAGEVCFHVGGGITWHSDPHAEDEETLHKARALMRALDERT